MQTFTLGSPGRSCTAASLLFTACFHLAVCTYTVAVHCISAVRFLCRWMRFHGSRHWFARGLVSRCSGTLTWVSPPHKFSAFCAGLLHFTWVGPLRAGSTDLTKVCIPTPHHRFCVHSHRTITAHARSLPLLSLLRLSCTHRTTAPRALSSTHLFSRMPASSFTHFTDAVHASRAPARTLRRPLPPHRTRSRRTRWLSYSGTGSPGYWLPRVRTGFLEHARTFRLTMVSWFVTHTPHCISTAPHGARGLRPPPSTIRHSASSSSGHHRHLTRTNASPTRRSLDATLQTLHAHTRTSPFGSPPHCGIVCWLRRTFVDVMRLALARAASCLAVLRFATSL